MAMKKKPKTGSSDREETPAEKVTQDELSSFAAKLEDWGRSLPETEKILLQLVVGLARNSSGNLPKRIVLPDIRVGAKAALRGVARQLRVSTARSWVQGGPLWARWSSRQY